MLYILGIVVVRLNSNPLIDTASTSILLVLNITTILTDVFAVGRSSAVGANHNQNYEKFIKYVDRMYDWNSVRKFGRLRGTFVELRATQSTCSIAFATFIDTEFCDTNLIHSFLIVP